MTDPMAEARLLVERLRDPSSYPHAIVSPVRVAETHISWVLLTGAYAYKLKKPIRLSFIDYSTLERRRRFCEEEVRLNRRYAPDLYLGVAAVCGPASSPQVDGRGEPLEYAVKMRQFDPRDELDSLVAARAVTEAELSELGEHVARFHSQAVSADPATAYGRADTLHRVIRDNFGELRTLPEAADWREDREQLERWVDATIGRLAPLIEARRAAGRVRECHGDLHCGNVVRWSGALTPFDGIEFDPALRFVDVTNDLAFLAMDLSVRGRPELRRIVLQSWTQSLGDFDGLPLLPLFEVYRALVRAKVSALRALQETAGSGERRRDCRAAADYLAWAAARTRPRRPRLLITCGVSGSGKTWMARALAGELECLHVRSDVERKRLAGLGPLADSRSPPDGGIYTREYTERTYARLADCASATLEAGENVIIDAAFLKRHERRALMQLAKQRGAGFAIVHCTAPPEVLRDRVASRARSRADASEAGLDVLARQPGFWEYFDAEERTRVVTVDTARPEDTSEALQALRQLDAA